MALDNSPYFSIVIGDYKNNDYPEKLKEEIIRSLSQRSGVKEEVLQEGFSAVEYLAREHRKKLISTQK